MLYMISSLRIPRVVPTQSKSWYGSPASTRNRSATSTTTVVNPLPLRTMLASTGTLGERFCEMVSRGNSSVLCHRDLYYGSNDYNIVFSFLPTGGNIDAWSGDMYAFLSVSIDLVRFRRVPNVLHPRSTSLETSILNPRSISRPRRLG